jgi:hypothetical protein
MDVTGEQLFHFLAKTDIFEGFTKEDVEAFLPSFKKVPSVMRGTWFFKVK